MPPKKKAAQRKAPEPEVDNTLPEDLEDDEELEEGEEAEANGDEEPDEEPKPSKPSKSKPDKTADEQAEDEIEDLSGEVFIRLGRKDITVTVPRDANAADTLGRVADLVDGL